MIAADARIAPDDVVKLGPLRPGDMNAGPFRGAGPFAAKGLASSGGAGLTFPLPGFSALFALALALLALLFLLLRGRIFGGSMALGLHFLTVFGLRFSAFGLSAIFRLAPLLLGRLALVALALTLLALLLLLFRRRVFG